MNSDPLMDESSMRRIIISGGLSKDKNFYPLNVVSSSNYSWWTLLPQNLFEQMQRTSNLWFLLISVFQLIPFNLNPTDSWSTIVPLAILVTFTLLKDAYNDYYRHQEDKKINNAEYLYWNGEQFKSTKNKELQVGHIVLIYEGEIVPADLLLLVMSSDQNCCYVNEANVYGSIDLVVKNPVDETQRLFEHAERIEPLLKKFNAKIFVDQPHPEFVKLRGSFELKGFPRKIEISNKEFLMRGSVVHGVQWLVGIVLYSGRETKTQLNHHRTARKKSKIEKEVNIWVLFILLVLLALVVFSLLGYFSFSTSEWNHLSAIEAFVVFTLLYNNIIPISLFVVMDIVRILQLFFIQIATRKRVSFKTGDVNEDLGQVEYVLADKTGTITEHFVRVHTCLINGHRFSRSGSDTEEHSNLTFLEDKFFLQDIDKARGGNDFDKLKILIGDRQQQPYYHFARCMVLCNSIVTKEESGGQLLGTSVEEKALAQAACELGLKTVIKNEMECLLEYENIKESYRVLGVNPFSSENRRSHILVYSETLGKTFLYVKGASDVMPGLMSSPIEHVENLENYIDELAIAGKRTMVLAYRELDQAEAGELAQKIETSRIAVINKDQRINAIFQNYERGLTMLGITGIEEEVSRQTKDTIENLTNAGIKIWLISGDTQGSVLSAAINSGLLKNNVPELSLKKIDNLLQCGRVLSKGIQMHILHEIVVGSSRPSLAPVRQEEDLDASSHHEKESSGNKAEAMMANHPLFHEMQKDFSKEYELLEKGFNPREVNFYITIDRVSFRTALSDVHSKRMLLSLMLAADFVCCHSFLPRDKSTLVRLLKDNYKFKPLVLAIGDGNNDIPMLQEAHVGIGINSKMSNHAQFYSEIVVSQFSDLKSLLLVHGHWNYSRMARTVLLFLYKNFILTVGFFFYLFFSDYSGTSVFDAGFLVGYNIFFTTLPVLFVGILDEDLPAKVLYKNPQLYSDGIYKRYFSVSKLLKYSALAITHGAILILVYAFSVRTTINDEGATMDFFILGTSLFIAIVLVVLMQITIDTYKINFVYVSSVVMSLVFFLVYIIVISRYDFFQSYLLGIADDLVQSSLNLLIACMTPLICLIISYSVKAIPAVFSPGIFEKIALYGYSLHYVTRRLESFGSGIIKALKLSTTSDLDGISNEAYEMKKYSLHFKSHYIEKTYREQYILQNIRFYQFLICFFEILLVLWTMFEAVIFDADLTFTLLRCLLSVAFGVVVFLIFTEHYKRHYILYNMLVIVVGIIAKYVLYIAFTRVGSLASALIPSVTYILFNVDFIKITMANVLSTVLFLIEMIYYTANTDEESFSLSSALVFIGSNMVFNIAIFITSAYLGYVLERSKRIEYKLITQKELSLERTSNILGFLLPSFVRKRVKEGIRYIAEDKGIVTVVFCDICDFDSICDDYTPLELTNFLDSLFKAFDQLCINTGVSKIETVGKTYMACSGLQDFETDIEQDLQEIKQARRAVEFALAMLLHTQEVKLKNGKTLQVKIGVNSGPVTAGVVGYHKPQFSLVGDTVNTASRMCSTLEKYNSIQISEKTYELLDDHRGLSFNKTSVEAKGKGHLTTYIVSEAKNNAEVEVLQTKKTMQNFLNSPTHYDDKDALSSSQQQSLMNSLEISWDTIAKDGDKKNFVSGMNLLSLTCKETAAQKEFRLTKMQNNYDMLQLSLLVAVVTYAILCAIAVAETYALDEDMGDIYTLAARGVCVLTLVLERLTVKKCFLNRYYSWMMIILLNILLYSSLLYIIVDTDRWNDLIAVEVMYIIILLNYGTGSSVLAIARGSLLIFVPWVILAFFNSSVAIHAANSLFVVGFALINTMAVYSREKQLRIYTDLQKLAESEINRTNELLSHMMPPHVVENMRQGKGTTDKLYQVTMLYADIVGFTNWSSGKTPKEVVEMLSEMFTDFDKQCGEHSVYKVHTIGDCYVVMGYTDTTNRDPSVECLNVLNMAFSMIEIIQNINREHGSELNMRIGLHTGEVIAGIAGTNIVRYDIYGPDVLIANKMESGGEAGKVNVSDITRAILDNHHPDSFAYSHNKMIEAKSVNRKHDSFFIERS